MRLFITMTILRTLFVQLIGKISDIGGRTFAQISGGYVVRVRAG
jgi:hypothetical protein